MGKRKSIYLNALGVFCAAMTCTMLFWTFALAQPTEINPRDPQLKEGQMFTVKLVPAGKQVKIYLVGKEMVDLRLTDVGMNAWVRVGGQMKPISANRGAEYFTIDTAAPDQASALKLKLKYKESSEEFNFNLK